MVVVVDDVGSSGLGRGLVIRTWMNWSSAAATARAEMVNPKTAREKT